MTSESNVMGGDTPPAVYDSSIAELIGTPGDIPFKVQARYFPFVGKNMQLANMTANNIEDIMADYELSRIEDINGKRRYEVSSEASRIDYIKIRAHLEASISLSRDGMAVRQLTSIHKHVSYDDGHNRNGGMLSNMFKGGSNRE